MAAITPVLELYKPGGGSSGVIVPDEIVDVDRLNANSDKIDAFAGGINTKIATQEGRNQQYYGPANGMASIVGMKVGDTYQESNDDKEPWRFDGSNWVRNENGLYLIRPTSVVNGSVEADGRVKFNGGQASLLVNGAFSSRFRDYVVEFLLNMTGASGTTIQLTAGGTPYTGPNYNSQRLTAVGSAVTAASTAGGSGWAAAGLTGIFLSGQWEFQHPSHVGPKFYTSEVVQATGVGYARESGWLGSVDANLYDGFRLTISGQTFNGGDVPYLKIYGKA